MHSGQEHWSAAMACSSVAESRAFSNRSILHGSTSIGALWTFSQRLRYSASMPAGLGEGARCRRLEHTLAVDISEGAAQ